MKKVLSIMISILLIISILPMGLFSITVSSVTSNYFTYSIANNEVTITKYDTSISGDIEIPSTIEGYPVTSIGDSSFKNCVGLTGITIPNSLTSIGDSAFACCTGLATVYYRGSEEDESIISIGSDNSCLTDATWHYNSCIGSESHTYDNLCDKECNICNAIRTVTHIYDNDCDTHCNICESVRTVADHSYTLNGNNTCDICKYSKVPQAPTIETKSSSSVTLVLIEGMEYSLDGIVWQSSNIFEGLSINVKYTFYQRVAESAASFVSEVSEGTVAILFALGDVNGDAVVSDADAGYLLMHTFYQDIYPVNQDCDFNKDGKVSDADAIYLLMHTFYSSTYPLY